MPRTGTELARLLVGSRALSAGFLADELRLVSDCLVRPLERGVLLPWYRGMATDPPRGDVLRLCPLRGTGAVRVAPERDTDGVRAWRLAS